MMIFIISLVDFFNHDDVSFLYHFSLVVLHLAAGSQVVEQVVVLQQVGLEHADPV